MERFDYLNDDLLEWADTAQFSGAPLTEREWELLATVRDNYLPEFEAAIWKLAAANARG